MKVVILLDPNRSALKGHSRCLPRKLVLVNDDHSMSDNPRTSSEWEWVVRFLIKGTGAWLVSCCNSATYADVRPPTVTHFIVAKSPETLNKMWVQQLPSHHISLHTSFKGSAFVFFPFPCHWCVK